MPKIYIFWKKLQLAILLKKMTIFVNLKKNVKFLAIFWHSNGNFPEGQHDIQFVTWHISPWLQPAVWQLSWSAPDSSCQVSTGTPPPSSVSGTWTCTWAVQHGRSSVARWAWSAGAPWAGSNFCSFPVLLHVVTSPLSHRSLDIIYKDLLKNEIMYSLEQK